MPAPWNGILRVRSTIAPLVFAVCVAVSLAVSAQTAPLMLVSTEWPPFTNAEGKPRFALDLVESALGRISVATRTTFVAPADFTRALLSGPYDGSGAVWKDAERERVLLFSQAYLENRLVLVGRSGANVSAQTMADLKGKPVAIVEGYSYGDAVEGSGIVLVRSSSEEDSLARLLKGEVEYTLMDDLVVQYIVDNYPKESAARLQIGSAPLVSRPLYFAIRRTRPDAESIISRFNAQLRGMITDRTYHRLLHVDWIQADVTGDGIAENVPASDQAGPAAPQRVYSLFTAPETKPSGSDKTGFYVGGSVYGDWASVPESYKEVNPKYPDPRRTTASIFSFSW